MRFAGVGILVVALGACGDEELIVDGAPVADAAQDVDIVRPGIIKCSEGSCPEEILEVPESIWAGQPFPVTVTTFGGGCESAHSMEVQVVDERGELRPFDRTFIPAGSGCTTGLKLIEHAGKLVFETPGPKTLTVFGRWVTTVTDRVIQIETVIDVQ